MTRPRELAPPAVIARDFDRIARLARPDEADPSHDELLSRVPFGAEAVLEVGCGTGALARRLARHARRVEAIDVSPEMVRVAQERSAAFDNLKIHTGDFMTWPVPERCYDAVVSVAALHHLPFEPALSRLASAVRPNGVLLIVDLFDASRLRELPYNVLSAAQRLLHLRKPPAAELANAWAEHGAHDRLMPLNEIRRDATRILGDPRIERRLGWRYSLEWRRPR